MAGITVANTSCLIGLGQIGRMDLLHSLSEVRQPLLDLIASGFYLSPQLVQSVLQQAGE